MADEDEEESQGYLDDAAERAEEFRKYYNEKIKGDDSKE